MDSGSMGLGVSRAEGNPGRETTVRRGRTEPANMAAAVPRFAARRRRRTSEDPQSADPRPVADKQSLFISSAM